MRLEDENYEEKPTSPLWIALISALITGGVFVASDLLNTVVDYGSSVEPEPILIKSRPIEEERELFSPERAKRRANYVLSQGNKKLEDKNNDDEDEGEFYEEGAEEEAVSAAEDREDHGEEYREELSPVTNDERSGWQDEERGSLSDLTLQGVLMGDGKGIAVLGYQGNSHTVTEGQSVGGYKVNKVYSDRVEVSKGGRAFTVGLNSSGHGEESRVSTRSEGHPVLPNPESVPLPSKPSSIAKITGSSNFNSVTEVPEPSRVDVQNFSDRSNGYKEDIPGATPTPMYPTRQELSEYLKRGAAIIADFKAQPDESGLGVKVQFIKGDNIMSRLGFKDGDVITRVNNRSILSSEELYNSMLSLSEMPFVNIDYKRNGESKSLVYDLQ